MRCPLARATSSFVSRALAALLALPLARGGPREAQCRNKSVCTAKQGMILMQVRQRTSTFDGFDAMEPAIFSPEVPLGDDGSQVSTAGPVLSLEAAVSQFGASREAIAFEQMFNGAAAHAISAVDGIAVVYVSGRTDFDHALREAVLQYVPMGDIFKNRGKTPGNFVRALSYAFEKFPGASWYYIADDDSFVHLQRLGRLAASLDPTRFQYVGKRDCDGDTCPDAVVECRRRTMRAGRGMPGWACGGPGVMISRPLAEAMMKQNCVQHYSTEPGPVCCGDMALACCAFDAWDELQILDVQDFSAGNTSDLLAPSGSMIAVHKISNETLLRLGRLYNSHLAS